MQDLKLFWWTMSGKHYSFGIFVWACFLGGMLENRRVE